MTSWYKKVRFLLDARMNSKPATRERIEELVSLGVLKEFDIPEELIMLLSQKIADSVDENVLKQLQKQLLGS